MSFFRIDGNRLRAFRIERGWTQKILAHRTGFSLATIGKLERGRPVQANTVYTVAIALGVPVSDLTSDWDLPQVKILRTGEFPKLEGPVNESISQLHEDEKS